jgi:hypothetical protein
VHAGPLRCKGEWHRAVGQLLHDRPGQGLHRQAIGVVPQQQVDGLQFSVCNAKRAFRHGQQAVHLTGQIQQRRDRQVMADDCCAASAWLMWHSRRVSSACCTSG